MNATRFAQKPLPQPAYNFCDVPKPSRDLKGSKLEKLKDREHFQTCMGEMLLLCKEAIRRRPSPGAGTGSKPLSLEYLADRLDVDDPLWGYIIRSQEGMMQGFCTLTTFTNYQATFRWDSRHEMAFSFDSEEMEQLRLTGVRKWDKDAALARGLQSTVRAGNVWNEGIVWPKVAELALLGGLGCGRALVSLVIEELECMRASGRANYDYVILQATDNSIPFYESMGFVRVGAVMEEENRGEEDTVPNNGLVSSKTTTFTTEKKGQSLNEVAKALDLDVWDIVFLNSQAFPDIAPTSKLLAGTVLTVPVYPSGSDETETSDDDDDKPRWYTAKENDTPRMIAKELSIDCLALVDANKARLPGLLSNSKLMEGTRLRVSHFHTDDNVKSYAHWAFPDDQFEDGEPSYMMAYKLNRRKGTRQRPFLESLAVEVSEYAPSDMLLPPPPVANDITSMATPSKKKKKKEALHPDAPIPPKRPMSTYLIYCNQQRNMLKSKFAGKPMQEVSKIIADQWQRLPDRLKKRYETVAEEGRRKYQDQKAAYQKELAAFQLSHPEVSIEQEPPPRLSLTGGPASEMDIKYSLFNKVVRLKPGAMTEGSESTYWYVLTYIPDLQWCHLAPMIQVGTFGDDKPRVKGRPKYKLVDEKLGKEVDISSSFCIPIKSKSIRRTADADKEEWDIIDDGTNPCIRPHRRASIKSSSSSSHTYHSDSDYNSASETKVPVRTSTAIKPSTVERKRKRRLSREASIVDLVQVRITYTDEHGKKQSVETHVPQSDSDTGSSFSLSRSSNSSTETELDEPPAKRPRGRPPKSSSSSSHSLASSTTEASEDFGSRDVPTVKQRGRPRKNKTPEFARANTPRSRPRRKSAPGYLGETPPSQVKKLVPCTPLASGERRRRSPARSKIPMLTPPEERPRRKAAPLYMGESPSTSRSARASPLKRSTPRKLSPIRRMKESTPVKVGSHRKTWTPSSGRRPKREAALKWIHPLPESAAG